MSLIKISIFVPDAKKAIELYEKAFGLTSNYSMQDENGQNYYTVLIKGKDYFCSIVQSQENENSGTNPVQFNVGFPDKDTLIRSFNLLKEGGQVFMEPASLPYSPFSAVVVDQFGINWLLMLQPEGETPEGW